MDIMDIWEYVPERYPDIYKFLSLGVSTDLFEDRSGYVSVSMDTKWLQNPESPRC